MVYNIFFKPVRVIYLRVHREKALRRKRSKILVNFVVQVLLY